jgi:hypothetical protein
MMAPPSSFHQLPPWSFLAETHLPRQRPSCESSLAPRNQLPSGSDPLTLQRIKEEKNLIASSKREAKDLTAQLNIELIELSALSR